MSKSDAMLEALHRLGGSPLQPGWFDVVEAALADGGYYIAPIVNPQAGHARASDPRTSHAAADRARFTAGSQLFRLLQTFGRWPDDGLTDEEAMERTEGVSPHSEYATRCSELRAAGLIRDTGRDRPGNSGTPRIVSEITEMGKAKLRSLS